MKNPITKLGPKKTYEKKNLVQATLLLQRTNLTKDRFFDR